MSNIKSNYTLQKYYRGNAISIIVYLDTSENGAHLNCTTYEQ